MSLEILSRGKARCISGLTTELGDIRKWSMSSWDVTLRMGALGLLLNSPPPFLGFLWGRLLLRATLRLTVFLARVLRLVDLWCMTSAYH